MSDETTPGNLDDDIKKLEERKDHLQNWQKGLKLAQDEAPLVQQTVEQTDWQIRALKSRSPEADEIIYPREHPNWSKKMNISEGHFPF
jgi:hypothetical protein